MHLDFDIVPCVIIDETIIEVYKMKKDLSRLTKKELLQEIIEMIGGERQHYE